MTPLASEPTKGTFRGTGNLTADMLLYGMPFFCLALAFVAHFRSMRPKVSALVMLVVGASALGFHAVHHFLEW